MRGWLSQENLPSFPGVLTVGGPLHISTVPGQESFPGGSGACEWTHSLTGVESEEAALGMQLLRMLVSARHAMCSTLQLLLPRRGMTQDCPFSELVSPPQWPLRSSSKSVQGRLGSWHYLGLISILWGHSRGLEKIFPWSSRLGNQLRMLVKNENPRAPPRFPKLKFLEF